MRVNGPECQVKRDEDYFAAFIIPVSPSFGTTGRLTGADFPEEDLWIA